MLKKIIMLPVLIVSFALITPVFADSTNQNSAAQTTNNTGNMCTCHKMNLKKMTQVLKLDEAQQNKIKTIKTQARENMKGNKQKMRELRNQIRTLVLSDSLDEAQLDKLIQEKTTLLAAMIKNRAMAKNQIYNVLNAQQKSQYKEWAQKVSSVGQDKNCPCGHHS